MANRENEIGALWTAKNLFLRPSKVFAVFRDPRTPFVAKILPLLALAYVFFPLAIFPDFIPILGQVDDISIVLFLLSWALNSIPAAVFKTHGLEVPKVIHES